MCSRRSFPEQGTIVEKRVTDLTVEEFLSYGPQGEFRKVGKPLFRRTREGRLLEWKVETDDPLCTLEEAFQKTDQSLGFDIELKFDDYVIYEEDQLRNILEVILKVVKEYAKERPIMFSSFQPDAAELIRKMQDTYPVYFITKGGSEIYVDPRRNTLDEAIKLCMAAGLQGIVSEAKAIFKNPEVVALIKESKLFLMTYGQLNNVPDAVYMQYLMGVEGVVVDLVKEIKGAVLDFTKAKKESDDTLFEGKGTKEEKGKLCFSEHEPSFWLKPIP
ncbi:Glycerophosphodiester phosphodiesterase gdpd3 [Ancistrocladus abbreviatus]